MTIKEAIEIFEKYLKCAEETCCIMDCFNCGYDIDDNQIYCAIEVAIKALKFLEEMPSVLREPYMENKK